MYQLSEQKRRADIRREKQQRLNQIVGDIEKRKQSSHEFNLKERQLSQLIQPKEMEIMDQLGKLREEETRVRKQLDDKLNRKKEMEKSEDKKRMIMSQRQSANDVSFYHRIIDRDQALMTQKWNLG